MTQDISRRTLLKGLASAGLPVTGALGGLLASCLPAPATARAAGTRDFNAGHREPHAAGVNEYQGLFS